MMTWQAQLVGVSWWTSWRPWLSSSVGRWVCSLSRWRWWPGRAPSGLPRAVASCLRAWQVWCRATLASFRGSGLAFSAAADEAPTPASGCAHPDPSSSFLFPCPFLFSFALWRHRPFVLLLRPCFAAHRLPFASSLSSPFRCPCLSLSPFLSLFPSPASSLFRSFSSLFFSLSSPWSSFCRPCLDPCSSRVLASAQRRGGLRSSPAG